MRSQTPVYPGHPASVKGIRLIHRERDAREVLKAEIENWPGTEARSVEVTGAAQKRLTAKHPDLSIFHTAPGLPL